MNQDFTPAATAILHEISAMIEYEILNHYPAFDKEVAKDLAFSVAYQVLKNYRGNIVYFPKRLIITTKARDRAIKEEFNGTNHKEIAKKYGLSLGFVYRLLKKL